MFINCSASGMADERRLGRGLDGFSGGVITAVAQIYGNPNFVHGANRLVAGFAQTCIARFQTAVAEDAAIVVGKLHDTNSQSAERENARGVLLQKSAVLKAGYNADLPFTFGAGDVRMQPYHREGLRKLLRQSIDVGEVLERAVQCLL